MKCPRCPPFSKVLNRREKDASSTTYLRSREFSISWGHTRTHHPSWRYWVMLHSAPESQNNLVMPRRVVACLLGISWLQGSPSLWAPTTAAQPTGSSRCQPRGAVTSVYHRVIWVQPRVGTKSSRQCPTTMICWAAAQRPSDDVDRALYFTPHVRHVWTFSRGVAPVSPTSSPAAIWTKRAIREFPAAIKAWRNIHNILDAGEGGIGTILPIPRMVPIPIPARGATSGSAGSRTFRSR